MWKEAYNCCYLATLYTVLHKEDQLTVIASWPINTTCVNTPESWLYQKLLTENVYYFSSIKYNAAAKLHA